MLLCPMLKWKGAQKRRRAACALTAVLLCAGFTGCRWDAGPVPPALLYPVGAQSVEEKAAPGVESIRAAVNPQDTLNPYSLTSRMNECLVPLLYDPLFKLDGVYQAQPCLAESFSAEGTRYTIRLRPDAAFWNGAPLTAEDVIYSAGLLLARDTGKRYANVASYRAVDARTVEFILVRPDLYFLNLLTFSVIQQGGAGERIPQGSGRFMPTDGTRLTRNPAHFDSGAPDTSGSGRGVKTVELVELPDGDEIGYKLIAGELDWALQSAQDAQPGVAGGVPVQTNEMVYLGFNSQIYPTDRPEFRRAIESLIDRSALVGSAFDGRAVAADYPVNPVFYGAAGLPEPNREDPGALLDAMGLDKLSPNGWRMIGQSELQLQLCINVEGADKRAAAAVLVQQLEKSKLRVALNEYTFEQYKAQVASGGYNLYLGQVRLAEDMDLSPLLAPNGSMHFFLGDTGALYEQYLTARRGEAPFADFMASFFQQMPLVPLVFPQSVISHSRNFYSPVLATEEDIFYNIHKW